MRKAALGLTALMLTLAGPAISAPAPIEVRPAPAVSTFHGAAPAPLAIAPPVQLSEPPTIISPPAPSPNGIYSNSPPQDDPCNTNVAVVQQSGCQ